MRENMLKNRAVIVGIVFFVLSSTSVSATDIGGSLSGTLTSAGNPYIVISDLTVPSGDSLTIEEGVEMRFKKGFKMTANGPLYVNGTSSAPVVFTSNEAIPAKRDWEGIEIRNDAQIENVSVRYSNFGLYVQMATGTQLYVADSIFEYNESSSISISGDGENSLPANITRCVFNDNSCGISIYGIASGSAITNCIFSANGAPIKIFDSYPSLSGLVINQNHTRENGICLGGPWEHSGTLHDAGYPYIGDFLVSPGVVLTIEKGVILKVGGVILDPAASSLIINGTEEEPVVVTSLDDDEIGGDTNCDGPSAGDHFIIEGSNISINHGIFRYGELIIAPSQQTPSIGGIITNSVFEYSFSDSIVIGIGPGEIYVPVNITNTVFRYSYSGIRLSTGCFTESVISGCDFIQNSVYGISCDNGNSGIRVINSDFSGNGTAVRVDATSTVNLGSTVSGGGYNQFACNGVDVENLNATALPAENNWWGEAPPDTSKIVGSVDYEPYLAGPVREILTNVFLAPSGISDILFSWPDLSNGCGYRVYRSALPNKDFTDVSGALSTASYTDPGAVSIPGILFYKVEIE